MEPGTILLLIVFLIVCLLLSIFCLLIYSGLISCWTIEIRAERPKFGALLIAYKYGRGSYKNAGQLFTELHNYTPSLKSIGLYYGDPDEVATSDLRYAIGAIVAEGDIAGDKTGNHEYADLLVQHGFKLQRLPSVSHALTTEFPFKNTMSIIMAVARVYPKLSRYMKDRNLCAHPMIEVYDNDIIYFYAPLAKQDEFYVPEALEEPPEEEIDDPIRQRQSDRSASVSGGSSSSFEELEAEK